jgi:hypothetical protein
MPIANGRCENDSPGCFQIESRLYRQVTASEVAG